MAEVTQAERDYVAVICETMHMSYAALSAWEHGTYDNEVRAIIDYIRNNPIPTAGA